MLIDASGEKAAWVFTDRMGGSLTAARIWITGGSNLTDIKLSVQGVDASGDPDGTILSSGNASAVLSGYSAGQHTFTFTSSASLTRNTQYALVAEFDSTVGNVLFASRKLPTSAFHVEGSNNQYSDHYTGSWSKDYGFMPIALYYSGSLVTMPGMGLNNNTNTSFNNASSPDEIGVRFKMPFTAEVIGAWAEIDADGDFDMKLYQTDDTLLVSGSHGASGRYLDQFRMHFVWFAPTVIKGGQDLRLSVLPTTTTSVRLVRTITEVADISYGGDVVNTDRTNAGVWTDDAVTDYIHHMGLIIHKVHLNQPDPMVPQIVRAL